MAPKGGRELAVSRLETQAEKALSLDLPPESRHACEVANRRKEVEEIHEHTLTDRGEFPDRQRSACGLMCSYKFLFAHQTVTPTNGQALITRVDTGSCSLRNPLRKTHFEHATDLVIQVRDRGVVIGGLRGEWSRGCAGDGESPRWRTSSSPLSKGCRGMKFLESVNLVGS